jgi:DNA-directed RNA polymerase subunit delta
VNEFGEITSTLNAEEMNAFLNKNVFDKKLQNKIATPVASDDYEALDDDFEDEDDDAFDDFDDDYDDDDLDDIEGVEFNDEDEGFDEDEDFDDEFEDDEDFEDDEE